MKCHFKGMRNQVYCKNGTHYLSSCNSVFRDGLGWIDQQIILGIAAAYCSLRAWAQCREQILLFIRGGTSIPSGAPDSGDWISWLSSVCCVLPFRLRTRWWWVQFQASGISVWSLHVLTVSARVRQFKHLSVFVCLHVAFRCTGYLSGMLQAGFENGELMVHTKCVGSVCPQLLSPTPPPFLPCGCRSRKPAWPATPGRPPSCRRHQAPSWHCKCQCAADGDSETWPPPCRSHHHPTCERLQHADERNKNDSVSVLNCFFQPRFIFSLWNEQCVPKRMKDSMVSKQGKQGVICDGQSWTK